MNTNQITSDIAFTVGNFISSGIDARTAAAIVANGNKRLERAILNALGL